jgi:hypothetical protein
VASAWVKMYREYLSLYKRASLLGALAPYRIEKISRRLLAAIDLNECDSLKTKLAAYREVDPESAAKYTDVRYWIRLNVFRVFELKLINSPRLKIMDIGAGAGFLSHVLRSVGHHVDSLDLPVSRTSEIEQIVFPELRKILGVRLNEGEIKHGVSLPWSSNYDLMVSYLTCFNAHKTHSEWSVTEWSWFLDEVERKMNKGQRLIVDLNAHRQKYGSLLYYDRETLELFLSRGEVRGSRVTIVK